MLSRPWSHNIYTICVHDMIIQLNQLTWFCMPKNVLLLRKQGKTRKSTHAGCMVIPDLCCLKRIDDALFFRISHLARISSAKRTQFEHTWILYFDNDNDNQHLIMIINIFSCNGGLFSCGSRTPKVVADLLPKHELKNLLLLTVLEWFDVSHV